MVEYDKLMTWINSGADASAEECLVIGSHGEMPHSNPTDVMTLDAGRLQGARAFLTVERRRNPFVHELRIA